MLANVLITLLFLLLPSLSWSAEIPEQLADWEGWVLHEHPETHCPFVYNHYQQRVCAWPEVLQLQLGAKGGEFAQGWQVQAESSVLLPGQPGAWPQDVRVDGEKVSVLNDHGAPSIQLPAGKHVLSGRFHWAHMPNALKLPPNTALLTLQLQGKKIAIPHIESDGRLWLNESAVQSAAATEREQLRLRIYRRIIDEIPMRWVTYLDMQVTGRAREHVLPRLLPETAIPLRIKGKLPMRLENDGRLRLQLRPGHWTLQIESRFLSEMNALSYFSTGLTDHELWVWDARPALRMVEVHGVKGIDPSQTTLPKAWHQLPAYRLMDGDKMIFDSKRRGDPQPSANNFSLQRSWWLDFDGQGFTFSDTIRGEMRNGWRLQMMPSMQLGRVSVNGDNQLITRLSNEQGSGVEVRHGSVRLQADGRYDGHQHVLPALGWQDHFNDVEATLHLPPGWRLIAVAGADLTGDGSWLSQWTLLDLFLVLIAALAMYRLYGIGWGSLTLCCLVLLWHEPSAPRWIWLVLIMLAALLHVAPAGKLEQSLRWLRYAVIVVLVMIAIPFIIHMLRTAVYPQLEQPSLSYAAIGMAARDTAVMAEQKAAAPAEAPATRKRVEPVAGAAFLASYEASPLSQYEAQAGIQTGPGLPDWQWESLRLRWNGPVEANQSLRLWLLSPSFVSALKLLSVLLLVLLAARLSGLSHRIASSWPVRFLPMASVLLLLPLCWPSAVQADGFPSPKLLKSLQQRLLEAPSCSQQGCASIPRMELDIVKDELQLTMEVHAADDVAIPVPGNRRDWMPQHVWLDGQKVTLIQRQQRLWLALPRGVHRLQLRGAVSAAASLQLPLPLLPAYSQVHADGWKVSGVHRDGTVEPALQLMRLMENTSANAPLQPSTLPPLLQLRRTLHLGLQWEADYVLKRLSPRGSMVVADVPLLAGESITTDGIELREGKAHIQLAPEVNEVRWHTLLTPLEVLHLQAAENSQWVEQWQLDISPLWHADIQGIPQIHHQQGGRWLPQWQPWPGEALVVRLSQPDAVLGETKTLDRVALNITAGSHSQDASLELHLRSSQADTHMLRLPESAQLQQVIVDGLSRPLRQEADGLLRFPLHPGAQDVKVEWQQALDFPMIWHLPAIDVGLAGVNAELSLKLPYNRWVLGLSGPSLGPAILFWGVLLTIILVALLLGRTQQTPLTTMQWLLLGIGLSQVSVSVGLLVVAWLFAMAARGRLLMTDTPHFNMMQFALAVLSMMAIAALIVAVGQGLLGHPSMQISGHGSTAQHLHWYADHFATKLPEVTVISLPMWVYRLLMLAWSLWLAFALLQWLKWAWQCYTHDGLWHKKEPEDEQTLP